ncbi:MAG: CBS domain-containing protein, partial [Desulfatiglandales bacterium]
MAQRERTEDIIVTHTNADLDALGSMIAARKLYPDAALVFPGGQEKNIKDFFISSAGYFFNFKKPRQIDLNKVKRLIVVDTRQRSRIGLFSELVGVPGVEIHIYDHHPPSEDDIEGDVSHISYLGSNTALMCQILREKGITPTPVEATIMCLGIHEDTGSFTFSSTTAQDYIQAGWLAQHGADQNVISDLLSRDLSSEQVSLLNQLLENGTRHLINGHEVLITRLAKETYVPDFAILVHKLMEMENAKVIFAIAQMEDKVYIVARSKKPEVDVSKIVRHFGGGGHPYAASATVKDMPLTQVEAELLNTLHLEVRNAVTAKDIMSAPPIWISEDQTLHTASQMLNRYNINVLLVMGEGRLKGYLTRQIIEKAIYFGLEEAKVQDYMNVESVSVKPNTPLKEIQDLVVKGKYRIIPVMEGEEVVGVITRTDILQILLGDEAYREPLSKDSSGLLPSKSMLSILREGLPDRVLERLSTIGKVADEMGYNAYLVGGVVRDLILKRPNWDLDVVVEGDGIELANQVGKRLGARVRPHKKFGTAIMIFEDNLRIDFATARIEYYNAPGAPPIVETSCLKRDMYRRDFTINTLAVKLNQKHFGTLIDYYGGLKDIKEKTIRVLHNLSFVEDPTRILRAIRFEQRFGFKIGKLTLSLLKTAVRQNLLAEASGHRIFHEFILMLQEESPEILIERLFELNILPQIMGYNIQFDTKLKELSQRITQVVGWFKLLYLDEPFEAWRVYLYGLLDRMDQEQLLSFQKRMGMFDKRSKRMVDQAQKVSPLLKELNMFRGNNFQLKAILKEYDTEFLLFLMAKTGSEKVRKEISSYFTKLKDIKTFIRGKDLLEMGLKPGPIVGEVLERVLEARL